MINYIKQLYFDWIAFRLIRNNFDVLDPTEHRDLLTYLVNRYNETDETSIGNLMLHELMKELVKWNISQEFYRWYMMSLLHRQMLFRNNKKLLLKTKQ